jgi:hypothetical protein
MRAILACVLAAASCPAAAQQSSSSGAPEPKVQRIVVEDDAVRIEELRVRGQTQRIVVKPKNAAEYEIVAPTGGRDPSQNRGNQQPGAAGQRVWNLLRF